MFQELSNGIKKFSIHCVLTQAIALWKFGSPPGFQLPKWEFTWECEGSFLHTFIHSQASLLAHNLASPCLGCEHKVKVATPSIIHIAIWCSMCVTMYQKDYHCVFFLKMLLIKEIKKNHLKSGFQSIYCRIYLSICTSMFFFPSFLWCSHTSNHPYKDLIWFAYKIGRCCVFLCCCLQQFNITVTTHTKT
jgi:hypothetical protein